MDEPKNVPPHDAFVPKIVKDPKKAPFTVLFVGYLGPSSEEGHTRFYLDATLNRYFEIPNDAILNTEPIPQSESPLGGHYVWIRADAQLIHKGVAASRLKASFLEGRIYQTFGPAAAAMGDCGPCQTAGTYTTITPPMACTTPPICTTITRYPCTTGGAGCS